MSPDNAASQDEATQERLQQTVQDVTLGLKAALDHLSCTMCDQRYAELVGKLSVHYFTENLPNTSILDRVISILTKKKTNKKEKRMSGKELELKDFFDDSVDNNENKQPSPLFHVSDGGSIQIDQFVMHQYVQPDQGIKKEE